jgi:hypothetical protein
MQRPTTTVGSIVLSTFGLLAIHAAAAEAERKYAPFSEYEMERSAEIALARSAAPERISSRATIKVLTRAGFEVAVKGDNGFVCMVVRSWSAAPDVQTTFYAKLRAPTCFDPIAARTVVPVDELKTKLGLEGKQPEAIEQEVAVRYGRGQLPKMEGAAFAYMWSASQDTGPGFGPWHPHMMVYVPYYENSMLGGNEVGGHAAPFVAGEGTPYSTVMIVVDDKLAIKAGGK